jgi:hypothetical protein
MTLPQAYNAPDPLKGTGVKGTIACPILFIEYRGGFTEGGGDGVESS